MKIRRWKILQKYLPNWMDNRVLSLNHGEKKLSYCLNQDRFLKLKGSIQLNPLIPRSNGP